ncbi:MAG: cytochrome c [Acidobacteria bacterium]|nr:cytochrome c [Acidobacteriota bacterium]
MASTSTLVSPVRRTGRFTAGRPAVVAGVLLAAALVAGCRQDMHDTPRYEALEASDFFADKRAMRPIPDGTVARGNLRADDVYYTGKQDGEPIHHLPAQIELNQALLDRGQQRYDIYCSPCHSPLGDGNGTVVQRGYKRPASYADPRLRAVGIGYFYDVITNGFGQMPDYAAQVAPADRWAIAAYIRALQLSQSGTIDDVPADQRGTLDGPAAAAPLASHEGGAAHE